MVMSLSVAWPFKEYTHPHKAILGLKNENKSRITVFFNAYQINFYNLFIDSKLSSAKIHL